MEQMGMESVVVIEKVVEGVEMGVLGDHGDEVWDVSGDDDEKALRAAIAECRQATAERGKGVR